METYSPPGSTSGAANSGTSSRVKDWTDSTSPNGAGGPSASEAFQQAGNRFAELRDYASYFVAAKVDAVRLTIRNILVLAALGVIGLIVGGAALVMSVVLLFEGIAGGLAKLMGAWGADLLTGAVVLVAVAAAVYVVMTRLTKSSRAEMVKKYEHRKQQQRQQYGHDVEQRFAEAG